MRSSRETSYEFFKASHFVAAFIFALFFFWHCDFRLSSWDYFIAAGIIYALCFLYSQIRMYVEYGINHRARLSLMPNDFIKVTIRGNFMWKPGQHIFIRFLGHGLHSLTTHPFTICSLPTLSNEDGLREMAFYIRARGGYTARLQQYTEAHPNASLGVLLDGPYGGIHHEKLNVCNRLLIITGGSGAGFALPLIEHFLILSTASQRHHEMPKSMTVVIVTRHSRTKIWFEESLNDLISQYPALSSSTNKLEISIHLTNDNDFDAGTNSSSSPSTLESKEVLETSNPIPPGKGIHLSPSLGRPNLSDLINKEISTPSTVTEQHQSLGIFVCGPPGMQQDARVAAGKAQVQILGKGAHTDGGVQEVYLHLEHFS
ncbi:putative fre ferric reductase-like transmembrane component [Phaeomoniella chlamydospora]|uniref:ferric-chelate reductase (NADPH) n=1 Tax=Phaeomoniella chlamydospora TaxID=158046 RepID=A0A0G2GKH7_PHACM|nr:putative fre ferric reductase-like transmembrane component [Phaeomoniella chlamydospora]